MGTCHTFKGWKKQTWLPWLKLKPDCMIQSPAKALILKATISSSYPWFSTPWGRLTCREDRAAHQKFLKEPLRGTAILFCGCGLEFFSPPGPRGINSETVDFEISPVIFVFRLNIPKGTATAPAMDILRLNTLKGTTSTSFLFIWKSPTAPGWTTCHEGYFIPEGADPLAAEAIPE